MSVACLAGCRSRVARSAPRTITIEPIRSVKIEQERGSTPFDGARRSGQFVARCRLANSQPCRAAAVPRVHAWPWALQSLFECVCHRLTTDSAEEDLGGAGLLHRVVGSGSDTGPRVRGRLSASRSSSSSPHWPSTTHTCASARCEHWPSRCVRANAWWPPPLRVCVREEGMRID
jgi:hypothetical protein